MQTDMAMENPSFEDASPCLLRKCCYRFFNEWYISGIYCQLGDYISTTTH